MIRRLKNERQEKIYNVAWADSDNRSLDSDGNLSALIDTSGSFNWNNYFHDEVGEVELFKEWQDPHFNADQHAAYYVRVLESINMFHHQQERSWTSPIYYNPNMINGEDSITTDIIFQEIHDIKVYPNPVAAGQSLRLAFTGDFVVKEVKLYAVDGKQEKGVDWKNEANEVLIQTDNLPSGNYILLINDEAYKQIVIN